VEETKAFIVIHVNKKSELYGKKMDREQMLCSVTETVRETDGWKSGAGRSEMRDRMRGESYCLFENYVPAAATSGQKAIDYTP